MTGWFRLSLHQSQPVDLWNRKTKTCCTLLHDITKKAVSERRHGYPRVMVLHAIDMSEARRLFAYKHIIPVPTVELSELIAAQSWIASARAAMTGHQVSITVNITPPPVPLPHLDRTPIKASPLRNSASVGRTREQDHLRWKQRVGRGFYYKCTSVTSLIFPNSACPKGKNGEQKRAKIEPLNVANYSKEKRVILLKGEVGWSSNYENS